MGNNNAGFGAWIWTCIGSPTKVGPYGPKSGQSKLPKWPIEVLNYIFWNKIGGCYLVSHETFWKSKTDQLADKTENIVQN
jgi:hypothetical protein